MSDPAVEAAIEEKRRKKREEVAALLGVSVDQVGDRTVDQLAPDEGDIDFAQSEVTPVSGRPGSVVRGQVPTSEEEEIALARRAIERDLSPELEFEPEYAGDPLDAPTDVSLPRPDVISGGAVLGQPSIGVDAVTGGSTIQEQEILANEAALQEQADVAATEAQAEQDAALRANAHVGDGVNPASAQANAAGAVSFKLYMEAIENDLRANEAERAAGLVQLDTEDAARRKAAADRDAILAQYAARARAAQEHTDEIRQALREGKVDTERSVGSKIFMAIALALTGGLAALQGRPNEMLRLVEAKEANRIKAQEANIDKMVKELEIAGLDQNLIDTERNMALAELKQSQALQFELAANEFKRQAAQKALPEKERAVAKRMIAGLYDRAMALEGEARKAALDELYKLAQTHKLLAETDKIKSETKKAGSGDPWKGSGGSASNPFGLDRKVQFKAGIRPAEQETFRTKSTARGRAATILKELIALQEKAGRFPNTLRTSRFEDLVNARMGALRALLVEKGRLLTGSGANFTESEMKLIRDGFAANEQGFFKGSQGAVTLMKGALRDLEADQLAHEKGILKGPGVGQFGDLFSPRTIGKPVSDKESGGPSISSTMQRAEKAQTGEDALESAQEIVFQAAGKERIAALKRDPRTVSAMRKTLKKLKGVAEDQRTQDAIRDLQDQFDGMFSDVDNQEGKPSIIDATVETFVEAGQRPDIKKGSLERERRKRKILGNPTQVD